MKRRFVLSMLSLFLLSVLSCTESEKKEATRPTEGEKVSLITLDPGHYHAALVQKSMYEQVDPTVYVYAPSGPDVRNHMRQILRFNSRPENPTLWRQVVHTGDDFLEKMLADKYIVNVEGAICKDGQYLMIVRGEEEYAPGGLNFPGGKVEEAGNSDDVLEETLRREISEEVGLEVHAEMAYIRSSSFFAEGDRVVDVVFLCRWQSGEAVAADPAEVAAVHWMTAAKVIAHPETPRWTRLSLELAEQVRLEKGW